MECLNNDIYLTAACSSRLITAAPKNISRNTFDKVVSRSFWLLFLCWEDINEYNFFAFVATQFSKRDQCSHPASYPISCFWSVCASCDWTPLLSCAGARSLHRARLRVQPLKKHPESRINQIQGHGNELLLIKYWLLTNSVTWKRANFQDFNGKLPWFTSVIDFNFWAIFDQSVESFSPPRRKWLYVLEICPLLKMMSRQ